MLEEGTKYKSIWKICACPNGLQDGIQINLAQGKKQRETFEDSEVKKEFQL